jgi:hypothetical protein
MDDIKTPAKEDPECQNNLPEQGSGIFQYKTGRPSRG